MNLIVAVDTDCGYRIQGRFALLGLGKTSETLQRLLLARLLCMALIPWRPSKSGKVLKNRINIILNPSPDFKVEGAIVANSLDDLFKKLESYNKEDIFVIGGASVYNQLLPYCTKAYVTKFDKSFDKDTYIPNLDESDDWICVYESEEFRTNPETDTGGDFSFKFTIYEKTGKTK